MSEPIYRHDTYAAPKPPGSPYHNTNPAAMSCIRCGHRNAPVERVHTPRYGKGQTVCKDAIACKARRSKT